MTLYNNKKYIFKICNSQVEFKDDDNIIKYTILYKIGQGSLSKVYLIESENNLKYVIKMSLDNSDYIILELEYIYDILKRNNILCDCIPLYSGYIVDYNRYCIIYPYFGRYNLEDINLFKLNKQDKIDIIKQIMSQLSKLTNCIHCDLKPSNIVINYDKKITIIDYGLIKELSDTDNILSTPYITSPESLLSLDDLKKYKSEDDIIKYDKHDYYGLFFIILTIILDKNFYNIFNSYLNKINMKKYIYNYELYVYCWYKFYYNDINEIKVESLKNIIKYISNKFPDFINTKFYNFNQFYDEYINNKMIKDFIYNLIHFDYNQRELLLNNFYINLYNDS